MYGRCELVCTAREEFHAIFDAADDLGSAEFFQCDGLGWVEARLRYPRLDFVEIYLLEVDLMPERMSAYLLRLSWLRISVKRTQCS